MTITKEGTLASFYTVNKAPIEHLRVYFSPKQAGEGDPSLENVREIEGWDGIKVSYTGKNLFDANNPNIISPNCWVSSNAGNKITASGVDRSLFIPCLPNTTYIISKTIGNVLSAGYTTEVPVIGMPTYSYHRDSERARQVTITTGADAKYLAIWFYDGSKTFDRTVTPETIYKTLQVEYDTASNHFEPYFGQDKTINWNATLYGGYFDLITGEIVVDWYYLHYKTKDIQDVAEQMTNCIRKRIGISNKPALVGADNSICNCLSYLDDNSDTPRYYIRGDSSLTVIHFVIPKDFNQEQDLQFAFKLSTPIIYQVSPTAIRTLIGQNNIWSNADRVEVEYDLAESNDELYRRRNIILNTPHIETVAGSIASFKTDMNAPLKECKIHFAPVQVGSGTPAPDNVREITGWTNLGIMHKNGLPSEYQAVEYLQSTGTQFITGYFKPPTTGVITLKVILEPESMTNNLWYCGGRSNGHLSMQVGRYTGTWYKDNNSDVYEVISATNGIEKIFCSKSSNTSSSYDYLLFGRAWDGSFPYSCKIFQCTLYFNDTPIYNYIPCYRKIDNVAGMYDTVNNIFYTNEGTGTFITGQNIHALPQPLLFESTNSFDWSSTFGTIYGGYVDLVKGELVQEYATFHAKDKKWYNYSSYVVFYMPSNIGRSTSSKDISDKLIPWQSYGFTEAPDNSLLSGQQSAFFIKHKGVASDAEFNAWLAEADPIICYKFTKPIHYSLEPKQLQTLRGTNNIWTNTNGPVEVKYWTH